MPRIRKRTTSRPLNLKMNDDVRERLEQLRDETNADSLSEVIRRAVAVYDHLWTAKRKQHQIIIREADGEKELILL